MLPTYSSTRANIFFFFILKCFFFSCNVNVLMFLIFFLVVQFPETSSGSGACERRKTMFGKLRQSDIDVGDVDWSHQNPTVARLSPATTNPVHGQRQLGGDGLSATRQLPATVRDLFASARLVVISSVCPLPVNDPVVSFFFFNSETTERFSVTCPIIQSEQIKTGYRVDVEFIKRKS